MYAQPTYCTASPTSTLCSHHAPPPPTTPHSRHAPPPSTSSPRSHHGTPPMLSRTGRATARQGRCGHRARHCHHPLMPSRQLWAWRQGGQGPEVQAHALPDLGPLDQKGLGAMRARTTRTPCEHAPHGVTQQLMISSADVKGFGVQGSTLHDRH